MLTTKIFSKPIFTNYYQCSFSKTILRNYSSDIENYKSYYITVKAMREDYSPVLKMMHDAFYPDEPTCLCMGIKPNPVMDERVLKDLAEGMSLLAKHKYDGNIVAACVNCSLYPWDPDQTEKLANSCRCPKLKSLLQFYAHITRKPNLWKCHGVEKIFEMAYVFVKPEHRKQGISFRLMEESKKLATDKGFQIIRCDATNFITARLCEKLGMTLIDEIPYATYVGQDSEPILQPPPPHESVKIYIDNKLKIIDDNSKNDPTTITI